MKSKRSLNGEKKYYLSDLSFYFAQNVDKDDILEDYLLTNEASKENIDRMIAHITGRPGLDKERVIPALQAMFGARESYFNAFMEEAERVYGSLDGFMEKALGIGEEEKNRFRKLYLEP